MIKRTNASFEIVPDDNWASELCEKQLAPVKHLKVTHKSLDTVRKSFPDFYHNHFARFVIKQGILTSPTPTEPFPKYILNRFLVVSTYLARLAPELPDLELDFYLGDGFTGWRHDSQVPIFMFSSRIHLDKNTLLFPDPFTIADSQQLRSQVLVGNEAFPWSQKISKAFWRGGTTGSWLTVKDSDRNPRFRLMELAQKFPEEIDVGFTSIHEVCEPALADMARERGFMRNWIDIPEHMHFKYLLLVDGFTSPWARDFWTLHSNSVVFKQMSDLQSWFYPLIKEDVHFLPIETDLSDLPHMVRWARDNDEEVRRIAKNAQTFASAILSDQGVSNYIRELLIQYARLC